MTYHASMNGGLPNQGETNTDFRNMLLMRKTCNKGKMLFHILAFENYSDSFFFCFLIHHTCCYVFLQDFLANALMQHILPRKHTAR